MLDAEHNFARPVPGGREVASWTSWVSVKPRSKPAGDTTCKTDTRVWPHRKSNKLQWADVFCKLHTNYASSTHTSCMAPRRGYDPWPLGRKLQVQNRISTPERKNDDFEPLFKRIFRRKITSAKMEKICSQITVAAFMQPLQYDLRSPAAKDNGITHAATARSNLDAAITM